MLQLCTSLRIYNIIFGQNCCVTWCCCHFKICCLKKPFFPKIQYNPAWKLKCTDFNLHNWHEMNIKSICYCQNKFVSVWCRVGSSKKVVVGCVQSNLPSADWSKVRLNASKVFKMAYLRLFYKLTAGKPFNVLTECFQFSSQHDYDEV